MRRSVVVIVAAVAAAVLAAGCMGDDGGTDIAAVGGLESGVLAVGASGASSEALQAVAAGGGITVVGTGSATAVPDVAEWSFGVQTTGDTAAAALESNSAATEQVIAALKDAGIAEDDLRTEQVSVYPRVGDDGVTPAGYEAANSVSATVRDLDQAGSIVDTAVQAGANQVYGPTLTLSDAEAQYGAAVDAAYDDALARAQAIATKAGLELGAPTAIVEGGGGGATPAYERLAADSAVANVPIQPGTQEVGATLTVTFSVS